jgi:hypothetical protein
MRTGWTNGGIYGKFEALANDTKLRGLWTRVALMVVNGQIPTAGDADEDVCEPG